MANFLAELPEKYREILALYDRGSGAAGAYFAPGSCPLLSVQACLRMAIFCAGLWMHNIPIACLGGAGASLLFGDSTSRIGSAVSSSSNSTVGIGSGASLSSSGTAQSSSTSSASGSTAVGGSGGSGANIAVDKIVFNNGVGVSRVDVSSWVMRARAVSGFEFMTISDQLWCATTMASVYSSIGYHRKHAFFLRQTAQLILSTLRPYTFADDNLQKKYSWKVDSRLLSTDSLDLLTEGGELRLLTEHDSLTGKADSSSDGNQNTNPALECMKRVCEILGVPIKGEFCIFTGYIKN